MPYAVIMAGGAGTRLWPAARRDNPKQLQRLIYEEPIVAVTVRRLQPTFPLDHCYIVTAARYADPIRSVLPELPPENVISEPFGRNTAAAIALAAFRIAAREPEEVFAVFPADHVVLHPDKLQHAVNFSLPLARAHTVVDIGVPPTHPETGYGYIELGKPIEDRDGLTAYSVRRFVEKPDLATAQGYLQTGHYMWNSGMFVWQAATFLNALREHLPETFRALTDAEAIGTEDALQSAYAAIPDISVDYAIMERVSDVVAVPAEFGWRDVGDWNALYELMPHDEAGNAYEGTHVTLDASGSLLLAPNKLIAAIGVEDLVVVDTPDVLLVMRRDRAQDVKKILDKLKERGDDAVL
ncbi:MAG TPA: mannose-1-phosphate guanylyltransferase [Chloroflexota bacterium]|nr:mannose-1-phosphate guanylyltransferase [Chloroflexota bacterium]